MTAAPHRWSSRAVFALAAVGSAVGLGNFWRFPYAAGENGGGAYVLLYLACVAFVAAPVMLAEYAIGRHGRRSGASSIAAAARDSNASPRWAFAGWLGVATSFTVLTFYSVVAGWIIYYFTLAFVGGYAADPKINADVFGALLPGTENFSPLRSALFHTIFMAITTVIVARGLKGGLEVAARYLMPLFFLMLAGLVVYAVVAGDAGAAAKFLFTPNLADITPVVVLDALGQALFSLGVGGAVMITYGAYLEDDVRLGSSTAVVAGCDTLVALLAGLAMFPLVLALGLDVAQGPGLFFVTLPTVFGGLSAGAAVGAVFFLLAFLAAVTSSISMLEVATPVVVERTGWPRSRVAVGIAATAWAIGMICVLAPGAMGFLEKLASRVMLPGSLALTAFFAGWIMDRTILERQSGWSASSPLFAAWRFVLRFVAPAGVVGVMILSVADWLGF